MEATLQRSKPKKHRTKSKPIPRTEVELVSKSSDDFIKNQEEKSLENDLEESANVSDSEVKSSATVNNEYLVTNKYEKNLENCSEGTDKTVPLKENNEVCEKDNINSVNLDNCSDSTDKTSILKGKDEACEKKKIDSKEIIEVPVNHADNVSDQTSAKQTCLYPSIGVLSSKQVSLLQKEVDITKLQSLHMYPDLKSLQYCEQMHNIVSSQTMVKTYTDDYKAKTAVEANKGFQEFVKVIQDLDKHPLMEMVHQYHRAKKSGVQLCSRIKYLKSDLKRKKDSLWKSVKKEVSATGKCEDGYTVKVKHTFTIKEIDQDKFNEVKQVLKEIEDLLLSYAFHSYSEKVMKLKIEHYIYDLVENKDPEEFQESFSGGLSDEKEPAALTYKKCISVLFDSQRQNVQDRHYLSTCQSWLKTLVSKLMQTGNFQDNLFIINHVIRCPNGIQNWAAELVQSPVSANGTQGKEILDDACAQQILLALYLILNPVPLKEFFLKNIKDSLPEDGAFIVLDSEGEEEDILEMSKNWSDADIVALLNQIPVRSLLKHFLLDSVNNSGKLEIKQQSESSILKFFAYSTAIIDVLFNGLETYYSESFPTLFECISNLIRHILLYISEFWTHANITSHFKSQIQAVYDKLFFHIVFKIYNFEKIHVWRILPSLPYDYVSEKMLWNILWIFFSPGRSEEQIYSEKDVELKIKEEPIHSFLIGHIRNLPVKDIVLLLNAIEKISTSNNSEKDLIKFSYCILFKITILEPSLVIMLSNEGSIILKSLSERYPYLVSLLLRRIEESDDEIIDHCIKLFKKMSLSNWIPEDNDITIISTWLFSSLSGRKNHLARLILKNMNWDFNSEGLLFLPYELHKRVAMIVTKAYLQFDANNSNEGLISKGVKQILQFTSIGGQKEEEEFVHWAWNILFCLKLHPLDGKRPPWIEVYDGCVEECNRTDVNNDIFQALSSGYERRHPSSCYLILVMEGHSMKNLLHRGLECFSALVESEQYMAAIKSLYYILPFFVKHSEQLLDKFEFIKAMSYLITADLTVLSNLTGEPVIGAVLHQIAAMIKYQIYQAGEHTIECSAPLIKLWIKILMKMLSPPDKSSPNVLKTSPKQVYFLLDVLVKISFLHDYTRDCALDLLNSYCSPLVLPKSPQSSLWNRLFSTNSCMYAILNRNTIPEYPWLAWFVLLSEMKQKIVQDIWIKMQTEMARQTDASPVVCLKKVSDGMKVDLEFLPVYRWALQAVETPVSHPVAPLIWQQFFLYYFSRVVLPNSESSGSIGIKYFKCGPLVPLLKKIKKHLLDAQNFYRNSLKTPECVQSSEERISDVKENGLLYLNLNKLFHAFHLWIDDESLQNSSVCLSALDPKYCPYRLKLILDGDQTIWFDMVSKTSLKDVIDQKVHSWCFKKIPNEVVDVCPTNKESLPDQIKRHLENYETVLPPVSMTSKPTSVRAFEVNDSILTSKVAIVQMIEEKQFIIFDRAKEFCEQMKYLKQLNFNFINWVPQEYEVKDCEIFDQKECGKTTGCCGPAHFRLQIQTYKINERISERIENNRADYLIVQDQLSKLDVNNLCTASLCIENLIRSLANKMKNSKSPGADYFKKMGIDLFYHQINMIDKTIISVADYPASRQFFSNIIESLGREFIEGDESQLTDLAKSVLSHPEAGSLALPLFNPSKSNVENFLCVYKTLTSDIGKHSANTLLALFSKIDFLHWLNENSPNLDDRNVLFNCICNALLVCGFSPYSEQLPVFHILKRHFGILIQYMFPELFLTTVAFLLHGIENKNVSIDVYYEAFHCFGCPLFNDKTSVEDIEFALRKFAQNQQLPADQQIFVSVARLNLQQVTQISHLFYSHFMKRRLNCTLYKQYAPYVKPLGIFLAIISHSLIALHLEEISTINLAASVSELWETFHLPFWPWLHPTSNSSGLDFPWTEQELDDATYIFKIFTSSLNYFHEKFLGFGSEESVLSHLWNFYVQMYVVPGHRHYSASLCHSELLNLPWHQFHPCTHDIEGMCKVLQSNLQESKEFLSKISLKIPWPEVMQTISMTKQPDYVGKVLATLGKLLIISQLDCTETENSSYPNVFKEFEGLSWHFLSMEDIEILLSLFDCLDPFILICNWGNSAEFHVLQFLKLICCMTPNPDASEYSNSKRILYLQKFLSSLSDCCTSKKAEMQKILPKFKEVISSLFQEIDAVICNDVNPNEQTNYALPLVKEVITFLNNLPEGKLDAAALESITSWLSENKQSPLLLPVLKVSSHNLNIPSHMVILIECCIFTRFCDEALDSFEAQSKFKLISSCFHLRPNIFDEFVKKCVEENAYLALYCCLLHKLPHCDSTESKKHLLQRIIQWIRDSKLSPDAEAKFILLWDKLLELSTKLVLEEEYMVVRQELTSFCWILESLSEDRSNSGFFAIIGLGQASSLSVNFRFLCRVMSAFIENQIPTNCKIRMEPMDSEGSESSTSVSASKALDNLKSLQQKKLYSALQSQIDYAVKCISDPKYTFMQTRELLKYFALVLYPKDSYLSVLDS